MPTKQKSAPKVKAPKNEVKSKKKTKAPVDSPVVDPPVVDSPVVDTPVVDTPVDTSVDASVDASVGTYDAEFKEISDQLRATLNLVKDLSSKLSQLEKRVVRDRKVTEKKMRGRVKKVHDPNKPPTGFAKPGPVSQELRKFLGLDKDEEISRTNVTKRFTVYCKEHNLQDPKDKRNIRPDAAVTKLLRLTGNLPKGENLTFFNLQKYMKVHYPSKDGTYV